MAKKRMFTLDICGSDAFLDMPFEAQCLYFHLNLRADDDGFIGNTRTIMRSIGMLNEDSMKLLMAKGFVIPFESGIIVVTHWRMHNNISRNRYTETQYADEKSMLRIKPNKSYSLVEGDYVNDAKLLEKSNRQVRRDKDATKTHPDKIRIDKNSIDKNSIDDINENIINQIINLYNDICKSYPKILTLSEKSKKILKSSLQIYSLDDFKYVFETAELNDFLKGGNKDEWKASFDWLIKTDNMAKVLAGVYEPFKSSQTPNSFTKFHQRKYDTDEYEKMILGTNPI
ncbi:MAG: hypothetical protein IJO60_01555 [Agathobacter sp.]|nr:hypothetical protein [Agathobacter sp.]